MAGAPSVGRGELQLEPGAKAVAVRMNCPEVNRLEIKRNVL